MGKKYVLSLRLSFLAYKVEMMPHRVIVKSEQDFSLQPLCWQACVEVNHVQK